MRKLRPDPENLLPLNRPELLGLGVETPAQLEKLFRENRPAPPVLKIGGRNVIVERDRDAFRARLIENALREAAARGDMKNGCERT